MQLFRGLSKSRFVFVSDGTLGRHKPMVDIMKRVCELEARTNGRVRGWAHASEMATLVVPGEQLPRFPRRMSLRAFIDSMYRVNRRYTRLGYCRR